jgi:hypothetical protein
MTRTSISVGAIGSILAFVAVVSIIMLLASAVL